MNKKKIGSQQLNFTLYKKSTFPFTEIWNSEPLSPRRFPGHFNCATNDDKWVQKLRSPGCVQVAALLSQQQSAIHHCSASVVACCSIGMAENMPSVVPPPPGRPLWEPMAHSVLTHNAPGGRSAYPLPLHTHYTRQISLHNVVNYINLTGPP